MLEMYITQVCSGPPGDGGGSKRLGKAKAQ